METTAEIYAHVLSAVRLLIQDLGSDGFTANSLEEHIHTRLWSYVTHAVQEVRPSASSASSAEAPKKDGRSKAWQCVVRFWIVATPGTLIPAGSPGVELIAETDPEIIQGTGSLPEIVERYATEMHPDDALFPSALTTAAIKEKLLQLRNNLGRYNKASLRMEYVVDGVSYLCQVDVAKPGV